MQYSLTSSNAILKKRLREDVENSDAFMHLQVNPIQIVPERKRPTKEIDNLCDTRPTKGL